MEIELMMLVINDLEAKNKLLEDRLRMNKVFTYMVIHDLKHPTEAVIQSLKMVDSQVANQIHEN